MKLVQAWFRRFKTDMKARKHLPQILCYLVIAIMCISGTLLVGTLFVMAMCGPNFEYVLIIRCLLGIFTAVLAVGSLVALRFFWSSIMAWDNVATLGMEGIRVKLGKSQAEFMERVRTKRYEYLGVFAQNGRTIYVTTSLCTNSVYHAEDEIDLRKGRPYCISVHNHPGEGEGAFSSHDVAALLRYRFNEAVVVTRHRTYRLVYAKMGMPPERCRTEIARAREEMKQAIESYAQLLYAEEPALASVVTESLETNRRQELFRQATVLASQDFAKKYGFRFVEEEMC